MLHAINPLNRNTNSFAKKYLNGKCPISYYDAIQKLTRALKNDKINFNLVEVSDFLKNHKGVKQHEYQGSKVMDFNMRIIHSKINKKIPSKSMAFKRYLESINRSNFKDEEDLPF